MLEKHKKTKITLQDHSYRTDQKQAVERERGRVVLSHVEYLYLTISVTIETPACT